MRKVYDHQKTKFYYSERSAKESIFERELFEQMSVSEIYSSFKNIKDNTYFKNMGGRKSLSMHATSGEGDDMCGYFPGAERIVIVGWGLNILILCHEVAHHLVCQKAIDIPDHGPTFCAIYINLLHRFCDPGVAAEMILSFAKNEIEIDKTLLMLE